MSVVKLKNGKEKYINDEIDLRYVIFEELGSGVEDEYIKIIEKVEGLTKTVSFLENENKAIDEEKNQLEDENIELQNELNDLKQSLDYVKETINSLKEEYKYNEDESRKLLKAITNLERNIEI